MVTEEKNNPVALSLKIVPSSKLRKSRRTTVKMQADTTMTVVLLEGFMGNEPFLRGGFRL